MNVGTSKCETDQVCEDCGSVEEVTFEADPYASEINNDDTPHWMCAQCRHESARDI